MSRVTIYPAHPFIYSDLKELCPFFLPFLTCISSQIIAKASGWVSRRPLAQRRRASSAGVKRVNRSSLIGVKRMALVLRVERAFRVALLRIGALDKVQSLCHHTHDHSSTVT